MHAARSPTPCETKQRRERRPLCAGNKLCPFFLAAVCRIFVFPSYSLFCATFAWAAGLHRRRGPPIPCGRALRESIARSDDLLKPVNARRERLVRSKTFSLFMLCFMSVDSAHRDILLADSQKTLRVVTETAAPICRARRGGIWALTAAEDSDLCPGPRRSEDLLDAALLGLPGNQTAAAAITRATTGPAAGYRWVGFQGGIGTGGTATDHGSVGAAGLRYMLLQGGTSDAAGVPSNKIVLFASWPCEVREKTTHLPASERMTREQ